MLDRERILAKVDELSGYLGELQQVIPKSFAEYRAKLAERRACERILQLSIECMTDICGLFVSGLRLGLPAQEDDLFEKLGRAKVLSPNLAEMLKTMKGFRNILVHEYGGIDDVIVYKVATTRVGDLEAFKVAILRAVEEKSK